MGLKLLTALAVLMLLVQLLTGKIYFVDLSASWLRVRQSEHPDQYGIWGWQAYIRRSEDPRFYWLGIIGNCLLILILVLAISGKLPPEKAMVRPFVEGIVGLVCCAIVSKICRMIWRPSRRRVFGIGSPRTVSLYVACVLSVLPVLVLVLSSDFRLGFLFFVPFLLLILGLNSARTDAGRDFKSVLHRYPNGNPPEEAKVVMPETFAALPRRRSVDCGLSANVARDFDANRSFLNSAGCAWGGMLAIGAIFTLGALAMFVFFFFPMMTWQMKSRSWDRTSCRIVSSSVSPHDPDDNDFKFNVVYAYSYNGRSYQSNCYSADHTLFNNRADGVQLVRQFSPGSRVDCFVNPADPDQAVLVRSSVGTMLLDLIPLAFAGIGIISIVFCVLAARGSTVAGYRFQAG